jgi:hypothetical protein
MLRFSGQGEWVVRLYGALRVIRGFVHLDGLLFHFDHLILLRLRIIGIRGGLRFAGHLNLFDLLF